MNISRLVPLYTVDTFTANTFDKELNNIVYTWNAHNAGSSTWDKVKAGHLIGSTATPGIAVNTTGLGAGGTASVAGTDVSGTITMNTLVADTPGASSDLVTLTFGTAYGAAPRVIVGASNDAASNLAYGVVRCRQADTTTAVFKLRSGGTPLPATTTATYLFNYLVIQ